MRNPDDSLLLEWEREAQALGVPAVEFPAFLRAREARWREDCATREDCGGDFLSELDAMDAVSRVLRVARWKFLLLVDMSRGINGGNREIFIEKRERWFRHLKEKMRELGIKKSDLTSHGLSWGACQKLYFMPV